MKLKTWFVLLLVGVSIAMMALQFKDDLDAPAFIWSLTPLYMAGLLFGARMSGTLAVMLIVGIQLVGSSLIGWMTGHWDWAFYGWGQVVNVIGLLSMALWGRFLLTDKTPCFDKRVGAGLGAAVGFFLISNFGSWAFPPTNPPMYPMTLEGLRECYYFAIPFFRPTLIACVGYSIVMFSAPVLSVITSEESAKVDAGEVVVEA